MVLGAELLNLLLYCVQQFGVAIGVGAQTIMLVAYISAIRDSVIDDKEAQFLRATRTVLWVSLGLMVLSGIGITFLHIVAGQLDIVLTPAYLFKCLLILVVVALTAALHTLPETLAESLLGGTWYALFVVHILAPVTSWINLLTLWAVWLVGFSIIWYIVVFATRERKAKVQAPVKIEKEEPKKPMIIATAPTPTPAPAPIPKPVVKEMPKIVLDAPRISLPPTMPSAPTMQEKIVIPTATTPVAPISKPAVVPTPKPVVQSPAGITTDTPFLPGVPPLQPIPTLPSDGNQPVPAPAPTATQISIAPIAASTPVIPEPAFIPGVTPKPPVITPTTPAVVTPVIKEAPVLQKPQDLAPVAPTEAEKVGPLGLTVMPKSPGDIK
jgi:hypothetical protein